MDLFDYWLFDVQELPGWQDRDNWRQWLAELDTWARAHGGEWMEDDEMTLGFRDLQAATLFRLRWG